MKRLVPAALAATLAAALLAVGAHFGRAAGQPLHSDAARLRRAGPGTDDRSRTCRTPGDSRRSATSPWWIADNGTVPARPIYTGAGARSRRIGGLPAQGVPGDADRSGVLRNRGPVPGRDDGKSDHARDVELHLRQRGRHDQRVARRLDRSARDGRPARRAARCYKGLAISNGSSGLRLYATDFAQRAGRRVRRRLEPVDTCPERSSTR